MMFALPFYHERPIETGIALALASLFFGFNWWALHSNRFVIGSLLSAFFRRRFHTLTPVAAQRVGERFLAAFTVSIACLSLFSFSVASGLIQNGEKPKPALSEELKGMNMFQEFMDNNQGTVDVKELIGNSKQKN